MVFHDETLKRTVSALPECYIPYTQVTFFSFHCHYTTLALHCRVKTHQTRTVHVKVFTLPDPSQRCVLVIVAHRSIKRILRDEYAVFLVDIRFVVFRHETLVIGDRNFGTDPFIERVQDGDAVRDVLFLDWSIHVLKARNLQAIDIHRSFLTEIRACLNTGCTRACGAQAALTKTAGTVFDRRKRVPVCHFAGFRIEC